MQAYYGAGLGDWSVVWERRAQPGDTILVHAGLYKPERLNYVDPMMTPFDGSMSLTLKGTREKPITIKAAGDGEVIFDGAGNHGLFDVMASQHHIFDGLTIRNTDVAIFAGQKEVLGRGRPDGEELPLRERRLRRLDRVRRLERLLHRRQPVPRPRRPLPPDRLDRSAVGQRRPVRLASAHELLRGQGLRPGHVIAHNAIAYFHDGIGISTYGTPEQDPDRRASSIDIYNNDIHMSNDDFVETDGGVHNVRVFNNRGVNAAQGGYSAQPVFGGPVYFIGNILYHVPSGVAFKFSAKPAGLFVYHNTIIGEQIGAGPVRQHALPQQPVPGPRHARTAAS